MSKIAIYVIGNGFFAALLYLAAFVQVPYLDYLYVSLVALLALVSPLGALDVVVAIVAKNKKYPTVPPWVDMIYDLLTVAALVYCGWMVTAILYATHIYFLQSAAVKVNRLRQAAA